MANPNAKRTYTMKSSAAWVGILMGLAAVSSTTPAAAAFPSPPLTFTPTTTDTFEGSFNASANNVVIPGVTAFMSLHLASVTGGVAGVNGTDWTFDYTIKNTSLLAAHASLSGFGFDTNPDLAPTGSSITGTVFDNVRSGAISSGIQVEFCGTTGNSCPGGQSDGLNPVGSPGPIPSEETATFTLHFASPVATVALDNFVVRYQEITVAGFADSATGRPGGPFVNPTGVPVPGPLAGVGLPAMSLLGGFFLLWRRRKHKVA